MILDLLKNIIPEQNSPNLMLLCFEVLSTTCCLSDWTLEVDLEMESSRQKFYVWVHQRYTLGMEQGRSAKIEIMNHKTVATMIQPMFRILWSWGGSSCCLKLRLGNQAFYSHICQTLSFGCALVGSCPLVSQFIMLCVFPIK